MCGMKKKKMRGARETNGKGGEGEPTVCTGDVVSHPPPPIFSTFFLGEEDTENREKIECLGMVYVF